MVFESIVVDLLNRFLGDYVENLDRSQLKLGIWGGDVSLTNLDVKESALDEFDLPVKVIAGHLGHLKLSIPWKKLYTAPVVATIDSVFVVAVPNLGIVYNEEKEQKAIREAKQKDLKRIEEAKIKEVTKKKDLEKKDTFTEKLVAQIIKNLQIKISHIHIRYEDTYTNPNRPFSAGMTLNNLSFDTTNEDWVPCILQEAVKMINKLVSLDSFAVYWNSDGRLFSSLGVQERKERMMATIASVNTNPGNMTYILGPVSSVAQLKLNPKPETDGSNYTIPKLWANLDLKEISISLSKSQYQGIMELLDSLDRMAVASNYRKYRPTVPLRGHPNVWWKFAMRCVMEEEVRRKRRNWSWRNMHNHRTMCKLYKQLYKDKLMGKKFTLDMKKEQETYEIELDVFNITVARKQAEIEVSSMSKKDMSPGKGWFSNWFDWGGADESASKGGIDFAKKFEEAMNSKEKAKLYEAIGYQENVMPTEYPPEFVENQFIFVLHNLILSIVDDMSKNPNVLKTELQNVCMEIQQRPAADALKFVSSMGCFTVYGSPSEPDNSIPKMVTSLRASASVPLLSVMFETNPLDKSCDQRVYVSSRSLQITYDAPTINHLMEVLKPPEAISLQQLHAAALLKLDDLKEMSATGLQYAIERHKIMDLSIDLKPSYIVIPEGGVSNRRGNQLVLNLGNLQMHSIQSTDQPTVTKMIRAGSTEDEVLTTMMSHAYDRFEIKIQDVAIILVDRNQVWENVTHQESSPFHLLQPMQLSVVLEKAIIQDDPRLPKMKITGELPILKLGLSDAKLIQVLRLVTSIPLPPSEPVPEQGSYAHLTHMASASTESAQVNSRALKQVTKGDALERGSAEPAQNLQMTELQLHFEIKEIALELSRVVNAKESQLVNFSIHQLGSIVSMHTFDMTVDLFLGGITVQDLEFTDPQGGPLYVVQTPMTLGSSEKLFTIRYLSANKKAPNFASAYNSTLQLIKVDFTNLDVILHQEAILSLLDFAHNLSASLEYASSGTTVNVYDTDRLRKALSKTDVSRTKKEEEIIDLQINAVVGSIGMTICNLNATICVTRVKGFETDVTVTRSGTSLKALLKDLLVSDPSPNAHYPKILSTVYGDVMNVNLNMYNDATEGSNYVDMSAVDMKIAVSLGRMKIVFLNRYVSAVLAFLDQFQTAKAKMAEASVAAAHAAKQGVEAAYDRASRVGLDICLQAPVIIVPQNSISTNVLIADLGTLTLKNSFVLGKKRNELGMPSMFDHMTLGLQNLKLSRAILDSSSGATTAECLLLEPISFGLKVVRNLTIGWYKDDPEMDISGQLAAVYMSASHEDYMTVMNVLSENLGEGVVTEVAVTANAANLVVANSEAVVLETTVDPYRIEVPTQTYKRMKFNIVLENFSASLYQGSSNLEVGLSKRKDDQRLGCVELKTIAVTGEMLSDSSMWANVILINCILDDTRADRKDGIKRLMESTSDADSQSMVDITYRQEENHNTFVDVKVHSFRLIVCLDYLLILKDFFDMQDNAMHPNVTSAAKAELQEVKALPNQVMTIQVHLQKPDLVLIENIEDINSNAVIFHNEIFLKVRMTSEAQNVSGVVSNLQLFTASYNPEIRDSTMQRILDRCDINLIYNASANENQHVDIQFTDINIHINPYTVQLLTNIFGALSTAQTVPSELFFTAKEYDVLWIPKKLSGCSFWYLNKSNAKEALEVLEEMNLERPVANDDVSTTPVQKEQLMLNMDTIIVTVEAGIGKSVVPLILLESSFRAEVLDWSSTLQVKSSVGIEIAYFNEKLAIWEPLLEPIGSGANQRAWMLNIEMTKNSDNLYDGDSPSDEILLLPPVMSVTVSSVDKMEVTLTRVCLDVISNLTMAFGEAVHKKDFSKLGKSETPYVVENHLGIQVAVVISGTQFDVKNHGPNLVEDIILEPGASVGLSVKDAKQIIRLSSLRSQESQDDRFFSLKIDTENLQVVRTIYVTRLEKRFYQLPVKTYPGDNWAFVVNTSTVGSSKVISLQSVMQVCNHLTIPVEIFYMHPDDSGQLESCGVAEPEKTIFIPTYALYTHKNEIFFKPQNKAISAHPFVWKELMKQPNVNQILTFEDKESPDSFYVQMYGDMEQIFHEYSNKKTMLSACYRLHLSPPILLQNLLPIPIECVVQGIDHRDEIVEGHCAHLTSARLGKSELFVTVKNYLDKNWTCVKKLETDIPSLSVWTFEAEKKSFLDLGVHAEKVFGSVNLAIYCPFWMVNKTGLLLTYRECDMPAVEGLLAKMVLCLHCRHPCYMNDKDGPQQPLSIVSSGEDSNTISHPPGLEIPVLFSFRAKTFFSKKKASLKVEDSEWSDKFALDVVGSSGNIIAKSKTGRTYVLGVQIKLSSCGFSKIIIFTPFNLLVNNSLRVIECTETVEGAEWISVSSCQCVPFWPTNAKKSEMVVRYAESSEETVAFSYKDNQTTLLRLNNPSDVGINMECRVGELSVIVKFDDYFPGSATVLLVNDSNYSLEYSQSGLLKKYELQSQEAVLYTWENPVGTRELTWSCGVTKNQKESLMKDDIAEFSVDVETKLYRVSFLDGMQRVLLLTHDFIIAGNARQSGELERTDQEITLSLQGFGLSLVNNLTKSEVMYAGITSTGIIWESRKHKSNRFKPLSFKECQTIESSYQRYLNEIKVGKTANHKVQLEGKLEVDFQELLLLKPMKRVLRRTCLPGLWVQMKTSTHLLQFHAKVNRLQIDNQLNDYVFPVVLSPVPLPKSVAAEGVPKSFAELSVIKRVMTHSDVAQFKYLKALIQEFSLKVDQGFLNAIIAFFHREETVIPDCVQYIEKDKAVVAMNLTALAADYFSQEQKNFYDIFHLSPIKVHLSFSMTGHSSSNSEDESSGIQSEVFNLLLQSVGVTLTEVQDLVFKLNYFEKTSSFLTNSQLLQEVISHYSNQAIKQLYVLVLGLDVIGNPVGLLLGLSSGVGDLFYEPFQGAIQGPEEFAEGLALGLRSLVGHTVGGAAGAFSRITGTLGKGMAALTMDDDYQKKRRQEMSRRTGDITQGLAQGGKGVLMGFVDGVTGVVRKPVEGAREEGFEGFLKGVGKGLIGVVARPTTGVVDFASGTLDAVKRAADLSAEVKRLRQPRYIKEDGIVKPYSAMEAEGNRLLLDMEKGKFSSTDSYVAHVALATDREYLMVTSQRVIFISKGDVFGQWNCEWQYTWDEILETPVITEKGIKILHKETKKKKTTFFGGADTGKIVKVKDPELSRWILTKMEETMRASLHQNASVEKAGSSRSDQ